MIDFSWARSCCSYLDAVDILLCVLEVTHDVVQLALSVGELLTLLHQLLEMANMYETVNPCPIPLTEHYSLTCLAAYCLCKDYYNGYSVGNR